ncbi:sugar ABC transporter ATP-binding protein [Actinomyces sp. B33]|uniref:sugar ABC transporter ATP-binding protein n=1 Tax=Actinomyces sp. B33 TaxID=2942131 RepID=UPI002341C730|nr:sugar ABC transporter ATP-binding protein [Actinomyces sp. B33]MDC4232508.1 sugar ABC transporter ATP-binding protein [Actinomyces sp. B33]
MAGYLVEMVGVTKSFPGVRALDGVDLFVSPGEIVGLLGENGAGKSTLMNVLGGIISPDEGVIKIDDQEVTIQSVTDATELGIAFVHQELALEPYLTVGENIFLGRQLRNSFGLISQSRMNEEARDYLDRVGIDVDPERLLSTLSNGQQQMIEITKSLSLNAKVFVFDEPTSSLSESEVKKLFKVINDLKARGMGIVYISHKMDEIFSLTDRVVVMRDGKTVGTVPSAETTEAELVRLMVGREVENYYTHSLRTPGPVKLKIKDYIRSPETPSVSFDVHAGEILGFYGLIGAGRSELFQSILGLTPGISGIVTVDKTVISHPSLTNMQKQNVAYVPENRKTEGLFLSNDVRFNATLPLVNTFLKYFKYDRDAEERIAQECVDQLSVKTANLDVIISTLSGGNQQKVLLGRWLATSPEILILDEPTRGIDVGAKSEIYSAIDRLASEGLAIILISSELNEVMGMSDRLIVMRDGGITKMFEESEFDSDEILKAAIG